MTPSVRRSSRARRIDQAATFVASELWHVGCIVRTTSGGPALVPVAEEPRRMLVIRTARNLEQVGGLERDDSNFRAENTLKEIATGQRASEDRTRNPLADGVGNHAHDPGGEHLEEEEPAEGKRPTAERKGNRRRAIDPWNEASKSG